MNNWGDLHYYIFYNNKLILNSVTMDLLRIPFRVGSYLFYADAYVGIYVGVKVQLSSLGLCTLNIL